MEQTRIVREERWKYSARGGIDQATTVSPYVT
jgi:hypothetical protein